MYLLKFVSRVGVDFEFVYVCPIKFRGSAMHGGNGCLCKNPFSKKCIANNNLWRFASIAGAYSLRPIALPFFSPVVNLLWPDADTLYFKPSGTYNDFHFRYAQLPHKLQCFICVIKMFLSLCLHFTPA